MKSILLSVAFFATIFVQKINAQDSNQSQPQLLTTYFNIKDALVGSNSKAAAAAAQEFIKAVEGTEKEILTVETRSALLKDAEAIAESKDLAKQRETFSGLSTSMYTLAKTTKLSPDPVYQQYCPMKKASCSVATRPLKTLITAAPCSPAAA